MGDVQHSEVLAVAQVAEQVEHAEPDRHVEHRHRLVGEQHPGPHGQRPGDRHPLPLPAGQLVRELVQVGVARGERDAFKQAADLLVEPVSPGELVHEQRPGQVVAHVVHRVQGGERVLQHHLDLPGVAASGVTRHASPRQAAVRRWSA